MLSRRVSNPADVSRVFHHDNPVSRDLLSEGPGFEDAAHQYAQREADYQKSDWQEAAKWKIKNLLRVNSVLLVLCFFLYTRDSWVEFTKPKPKVDPAKLARERALKAQKAQAKPK